jgi:hypothetical protein
VAAGVSPGSGMLNPALALPLQLLVGGGTRDAARAVGSGKHSVRAQAGDIAAGAK